MERAVRADHVVAFRPAVALAVAARQLDRALVGLGARVAEEHAAAAAEQGVEPGGDLRLQVVVIEVRHVQQRARLVGDRVGDLGVRVAERRDREPGEEVEVLACPRCPTAWCPRRARTRPAGDRRSASRARRRALELASALRRSTRSSVAPSGHHRSDTLPGEELEQQRVRQAAVEDVRRAEHRRAARTRTIRASGSCPPTPSRRR